MGEAWGVVCVPTQKELQSFHPDLLAHADDGFLEELFLLVGFKVDVWTKGRFKVDNSVLAGRFICLRVSEEGWPLFCDHVVNSSAGSELYASIYSEYGQRSFYARTARGETCSFTLDDDGDAGDQEGRDAVSDEERRNDKERKWLALVDDELKAACPPLLAYLRDQDFGDGDFNWDRYVGERHHGKLRELHDSLAVLHDLLSDRTVESCARFVAEVGRLPATDPRVVKEAQRFLEKDLEGFLQILARCAKREPSLFLGEWVFGFEPDGTEPESLGRSLGSPRFAYDETTKRFLLVLQ